MQLSNWIYLVYPWKKLENCSHLVSHVTCCSASNTSTGMTYIIVQNRRNFGSRPFFNFQLSYVCIGLDSHLLSNLQAKFYYVCNILLTQKSVTASLFTISHILNLRSKSKTEIWPAVVVLLELGIPMSLLPWLLNY